MPHQIYFRTPLIQCPIVGLELDPSFGIAAASRLVNFLDFITYSRQHSYTIDKLETKAKWRKFLLTLYSFDIKRGLYQPPQLLNSHCTFDPHLPDSDGGIALVDLTFPVPKYCFLNISQMRGVERIATFVPADVETYLTAWYGDLNSRCFTLDFRISLVDLMSRAQCYPLLSVEEARLFFPRHFHMNLRCSPKVPLLPAL